MTGIVPLLPVFVLVNCVVGIPLASEVSGFPSTVGEVEHRHEFLVLLRRARDYHAGL